MKIDIPSRPLELVAAVDLPPKAIAWLFPGWIAAGKLHVLAGAPGTGKTTLAMDIAASITARRPLPDGTLPSQGQVLVCSSEDDPRDTLVPRLMAAGADLSRIHFMTRRFDPASDAPRISDLALELPNLAMVIIDPLVASTRGRQGNADVRRDLAPLVEVADEFGIAILGITHFSKGTDRREPLERVTGSLVFGALPRVVMITRQYQEEGATTQFLLARAKSNIGPTNGGFLYSIAEIELGNGLTTNRIVWGDATGDYPAAIEDSAQIDPISTRPADFLRSVLASGPMLVTEIYARGQAQGFSRAVLGRAKGKIGARALKQGMGGGWVWMLQPPTSLPNGERQENPQDNHDGAGRDPVCNSCHEMDAELIAVPAPPSDGEPAPEISVVPIVAEPAEVSITATYEVQASEADEDRWLDAISRSMGLLEPRTSGAADPQGDADEKAEDDEDVEGAGRAQAVDAHSPTCDDLAMHPASDGAGDVNTGRVTDSTESSGANDGMHPVDDIGAGGAEGIQATDYIASKESIESSSDPQAIAGEEPST